MNQPQKQTFKIVKRQSDYGVRHGGGWHTVICPANNMCQPTEEFPKQKIVATMRDFTRDACATRWAAGQVKKDRPGWRMGDMWERGEPNDKAPLYVLVSQDRGWGNRNAGEEIHWILLDTYHNLIYALTGTHSPCFGSHSMSSRPEFYSGRGPNHGDLGPEHLRRLHDGLKKYFGTDVAHEFAKCVASQKDLSATAFLQAFMAFCRQGFKWNAIEDRRKGYAIDGHDDHRDASAMLTVMSVWGESRSPQLMQSQSDDIKYAFLRQVGEMNLVPKEERRSARGGYGGFVYG